MNGRERVLAVLAGEPVDHLAFMPITMMLAARTIGATYKDYCRDYRVLVEGQVATAETYGVDHISCISDPTREAVDCGAAVHWFEDQPPAIDDTNALLAEKATLAGLKAPDPGGGGRMTDRLCGAESLRALAGDRLLVEGWVEGPIAEGADLRGINTVMLDFFDDPRFAEDLLDFTTELGIAFALAQVEAGADVIGVGDAAASLVGPEIYEAFVWPRELRLVNAIQGAGAKVRLHICGNTTRLVPLMAGLGCDIVDIDYPVPMATAREAAGDDQVLLGNLSPVDVVMNGEPPSVTAAAAACHAAAGRNHVVSAGCEIPPSTNPANLVALGEFARSTGI